MITQEPPPGLKGRKRFASALGVFIIVPVFFSMVRVAMKIQEAFQESPGQGWHFVRMFFIVVIAIAFLALLLGGGLELLMRSRARFAAETTDLTPMELGVKSFEQAYWFKGLPVFWPSKHASVYLALTRNAIEMYTGVRRYRKPIMTIQFADITELSQAVVELPIGRAQGVVFHCTKGDFELGHTRHVAFSGRKVSTDEAQRRFESLEHALQSWKARQGK